MRPRARVRRRALVMMMTIVAGIAFARVLGAQPSRADTSRMAYVALTPGIAVRRMYVTDSVPGYRTTVQEYLVGPHQNASDVPIPGFAILQVVSGQVRLTVNGRERELALGAFGFVARGDKLAIMNDGELAVLRVMTFEAR